MRCVSVNAWPKMKEGMYIFTSHGACKIWTMLQKYVQKKCCTHIKSTVVFIAWETTIRMQENINTMLMNTECTNSHHRLHTRYTLEQHCIAKKTSTLKAFKLRCSNY